MRKSRAADLLALLTRGMLISAAAPAWAAILALVTQARQQNNLTTPGFAQPLLYDMGGTPVFRDIVQGNNNYGGLVGYSCTVGWDAVTGWGSPVVGRLVAEWS